MERLGAGGHGEVWRAADLRLDERPVALKRTHQDGDAKGADRVRREARSLARISHPHVVAVHDVVDDDGEVWVVMEHVAGRPLSELGQLSVTETARYGAQLAGGLAAAHAQGILHRDVKPANVLVTENGFAKLADFGISRPLHAEETVTATGALTGTPGYLAPEVVKGGRFTEAADIWSLGATLYHALEGTTPFGDDNAHALLWKAATEEIRPPRRAGAAGPILLSMLARKAGDRPHLERVRQDLAGLAGDPSAGKGADRDRDSKRRGKALLVAGITVVSLVLLSVVARVAFDKYEGTSAAQAGANGTAGTEASALTAPVGDPATADLCAVLDVEALGAFGATRIRTDSGALNTCDVVVTRDDGALIAVSAMFKNTGERPEEPNRQFGSVTVVDNEYEMPDQCSRDLFLADSDYSISVDVWQETWDQTSQTAGEVDNLCEIAQSNVAHATAVLNAGELPRRARPFAQGSLYTQSACDLLEGKQLEVLPGAEAARPLAGFAGWDCRWTTDDGTELHVQFEYDRPPTESDGDRYVFSGREVFERGSLWSEDSCLVDVVNRVAISVDGDGSIRAELVRIQLTAGGNESVDELCGLALDIAEPVAAALPPVS
ncbi:serine/threonine-protein kinase [Promicromonospora sp. NPDC057488]|uniref:serine/threonine-protein kinase n=1 Tax=Promicromonospora sp. NPDC057488 TaxID=3346147 RepID=UPI003672A174